MATTAHPVTEAEYLRTSYEHDPELIDGELKERPMPTRLHGFLQAMVSYWFAMHMAEWGVMPISELRTRVRPGRFRLPDVCVTSIEPVDHTLQTEAPLIAVEILSPDDSFADLRDRAADLTAMGCGNIWLIDGEKRQAYVWAYDAWARSEELRMECVAETPIHLDLVWLWRQLDALRPENWSSAPRSRREQ